MKLPRIASFLLSITVVSVSPYSPAISGRLRAQSRLEQVHGRGCYTYGDDETPRKGHDAARAIAEEDAVRSYRVYVQAESTVKFLQLESDVIESASAGMLRNEQTKDDAGDGRKICVNVTAMIDPVEMDRLIQQRIKAKETAQTATASVLSSTFGLRVWTNKNDPYLESEPLTVFVQSDRDAYLKLDYFQANGTVVHLVPNEYSRDAFIRGGQVYTFGGAGAREKFVVQAPFGAEAIKAVASTKPFDGWVTSGKPAEDGSTYLQGLQGTLRNIRIGSGDPDARWAETSATVVTIGKAAAEHQSTSARPLKAKP